MLVNGFSETQSSNNGVISSTNQCMTTVSGVIQAQIGDKLPIAPNQRISRQTSNSMSQTNSALAMSQLGTVYATKRRRRNGKRYVIPKKYIFFYLFGFKNKKNRNITMNHTFTIISWGSF